ncbi:MAG: RimK/LysX family protein [bacterium]
MINKQNMVVIGSKELISFPRLKVFDVPAKIDTGADTSSVWVSGIKVTREGLTFKLFNKRNQYYTGETITVPNFETTVIKNSSGLPQKRYKVRMVILVHNRRIRAYFTLADRSTMQYPILLGRRLLTNKFIVDVSKEYIASSPPRKNKKINKLAKNPKIAKNVLVKRKK